MLEFNGTFFAAIFHFILLLVLLRLVAYKPLVKLLEERRLHIESSIADAEREKTEAQKIKAEFEEEMKRAREKAEDIIQRATKAGEEQSQEIIAEAKKEAGRIKDEAISEIRMEKEKALAALRDEVASLSIVVAQKIINERITDDLQHDLIEKFIEEARELPC
ncbi:MAG: F0F1 ATP synthase subunit B [Desulfotomaculaceae bacterium]